MTELKPPFQPVVLIQDSKEEMKSWLFDYDAAMELMKYQMPALKHRQDYEQISLF